MGIKMQLRKFAGKRDGWLKKKRELSKFVGIVVSKCNLREERKVNVKICFEITK